MGPPTDPGPSGRSPMRCPCTLFIGFFEFGQGHRGPMIPYCPGAPCIVSPPLHITNQLSIAASHLWFGSKTKLIALLSDK
ncbi:unnamed protein product, partial [Staurois parvus]